MMTRGSNTANGSDFLQKMAAGSRARLELARRVCTDAKLLEKATATGLPPVLKLGEQNLDEGFDQSFDQSFDLIAELKRRSPAEGELATAALSLEEQVQAYTAGGAAALSVLTEPEQFNGSLTDLKAAVKVANGIPVMRKDFLVDAYQVVEARAANASGALLIAAILDQSQMQDMLSAARELGLFVLMEIFDERDLEHCFPVLEASGAAIENGVCNWMLGLNCRDLRTLKVDYGRFAELAPRLPQNVPLVAESGVRSDAQAAEVAAQGYRLALVGTALMKSGDPQGTTAELIAAGRAACS